MGRVLATLLNNRNARRRSICTYLNCGDPDIATTRKLIELCEEKGVDLIELGVPFANSFTDGSSVLNSHQRALQNGVRFEDVIEMVQGLRQTSSIPIVLLADFSYTVKERGLNTIIRQAKDAWIDGLLLHGLPPLYLNEYLQLTNEHAIAPVFSLYPNSKPQAITQTLANAGSFIYLVSQYGRTGNAVDFRSEPIQHFYSSLREATNLPLLAGFGIKDRTDIETIFSTSQLDGVIIGSAITKIIEQALLNNEDIIEHTTRYLDNIIPTKGIAYAEQTILETASEYTS
jgi:tryptophan synthase alpha chain